jgi:hypothetical protein
MTSEKFFHHLDTVTKWSTMTILIAAIWVFWYPFMCDLSGVQKSVWIQMGALCLSAICILLYALVENEIKAQRNIMSHPCWLCNDDCRGCSIRSRPSRARGLKLSHEDIKRITGRLDNG